MVAALRNIAILTGLAALAGAGLAWFAAFTADAVRRNQTAAETRLLRELVGMEITADDDPRLCEHGLVVRRGDGRGYGGELRLIVAFRVDGSIAGVRVLEHGETPGFGDILDAGSAWLESFRGAFSSREVHAVTGATVTSEAVLVAVGRVAQRFAREPACPP